MKPFKECLTLLLNLHVLIENGEGDSVEADDIRDKMDIFYGWCCGTHSLEFTMTDYEKSLMNEISGALYGINRNGKGK